MKKKVLGTLLSAAMVIGMLNGCGSSADTATSGSTDTAKTETTADTTADAEAAPAADTSAAGGKKVGVAMPTQSSERWINDGSNMKAKLEDLGYEVDLQYAEDDVQAQVSQIENMIASGVNCLVIASIDSSALPCRFLVYEISIAIRIYEIHTKFYCLPRKFYTIC